MRTVTLRVKLKKEQKVDSHTGHLFLHLISFYVFSQLQLLTVPYLTFLFSSSSSASRVRPVHTEPAKPSPSPLQRYQQLSRTASALWIFSGRFTAEVEGWWPLSAGGHAAVPPEGQERSSAWIAAFSNRFLLKGQSTGFTHSASEDIFCGSRRSFRK